MPIEEILSPNDTYVRKHGHEEVFCAYLTPEQPGELTTYSEAVLEAIALGAAGCVGFVSEEPATAASSKPDYSVPPPSYGSKRVKR